MEYAELLPDTEFMTNEELENIVGDAESMGTDDFILKRARERWAAGRQARRAAKAQGKSGREARRIGRKAKQTIRAEQLRSKAERQQEKGRTGRARRTLRRAGKQEALKGRTQLRRAATSTVLAPLIPLRRGMESQLRAKGITPPKLLEDLAKVFYNQIVVPARKNSYDAVPEINFEGMYAESDNAIGTVLTSIVAAIVEFFSTSRKKVETGEPVSKAEERAAKTLDVVEAKIRERAEKEAAAEVGRKILFDQNTWLLIGGGVLVLVVITALIVRK